MQGEGGKRWIPADSAATNAVTHPPKLPPYQIVAAGLVAPSLTPSSRQVRALLWAMAASSAAILLFLAATGFTTHRYEVDFLPLAVWVALASLGIHTARSSGTKRTALSTALVVSIAFGVLVNLALGIAGPYDEMLKNRPLRYVRIARWLSPVEKFRPVLNPKLAVDFTTQFAPHTSVRARRAT